MTPRESVLHLFLFDISFCWKETHSLFQYRSLAHGSKYPCIFTESVLGLNLFSVEQPLKYIAYLCKYVENMETVDNRDIQCIFVSWINMERSARCMVRSSSLMERTMNLPFNVYLHFNF